MSRPVLQLEPTDHCNLACRMCSPHAEHWESVHGIPKGYLDFGLYQRIIDGLVEDDCYFDHVILQWLGDPSLHPQLEDLVSYGGRQLKGRLDYLRFDTNAILLDERRLSRLVAGKAAGVPLLVVVTLDAVSEPTYLQVKGRDQLKKARRHVRALMRLRQGVPDLHLQVQFVIQEKNHQEAGDFLKYWRDAWACYGQGSGHFEVMFKRLSVSGGAKGQAAADSLYERTLQEAKIESVEKPGFSVKTWEQRPWQQDDGHQGARKACPGLWYTPVVRQDGMLLMCCADLQSELALGKLGEHGFKELWNGEKARKKREEHLKGIFTGVCASCGGINWMPAPEH